MIRISFDNKNQIDDYVVAEYEDTNEQHDNQIKRTAFYLVLAGAFVISVMSMFIYISALTATKTTLIGGHATVLSVAVVTPSPTPTVAPTEKPITILLDAGHGGFDPGTHGLVSGIYESDINLQITRKLEVLLKAEGYNVLMTRTDSEALGAGKEEDMTTRDTIIQNSGADIFISIHQNAVEDRSVCGSEVYYHPNKPNSKSLAEYVERHISQIEGIAKSRGVREYGHRLTKFLDYSILIECGFLTNEEEERKLIDEDYQNRLIEAIVYGINEFCSNNFK